MQWWPAGFVKTADSGRYVIRYDGQDWASTLQPGKRTSLEDLVADAIAVKPADSSSPFVRMSLGGMIGNCALSHPQCHLDSHHDCIRCLRATDPSLPA
jgi:hypothetical protein